MKATVIKNDLHDGHVILRPEMCVACETQSQMRLAIQIAMSGTHSAPIGWRINGRGHLEFIDFLGEDKAGVQKFPCPLNVDQALAMAWQWLETVDYAIASKKPDTDGSVGKGYSVYTFFPTHEQSPYEWHLDYFGSVFAVAPVWLVYGK